MTRARPPVRFVRHGGTGWNVRGLIRGWTETPPKPIGHIAAALRIDRYRIRVVPDVRESRSGVREGRHLPGPRGRAQPSGAPPHDCFHWHPAGGESHAVGQARIGARLATRERSLAVVSHGNIGRCIPAALTVIIPAEAIALVMRRGCCRRLEAGEARWLDAMV